MPTLLQTLSILTLYTIVMINCNAFHIWRDFDCRDYMKNWKNSSRSHSWSPGIHSGRALSTQSWPWEVHRMAQSFQLSTIRNKRVKWRSRGIEKSLFSPLSHLTNNRRSSDTWDLECSWPIDRGWSCNRNSSSSSSPYGWTFWSSEHFWTGDPPRRPQFSLIKVQLLFPMFPELINCTHH